MLGLPVAAAAKQRVADDKVVISSIIGDVRGRDVIVLDDEIARGTTILELLDHLATRTSRRCGWRARTGCSPTTPSSGSSSAEVAEIVCTNTVPVPDEHAGKLTVLSVAPALAEAMRRIHNGESVSVLFDHTRREKRSRRGRRLPRARRRSGRCGPPWPASISVLSRYGAAGARARSRAIHLAGSW